MAKIWKPLDRLTYQNWIDAIKSEDSDMLSDWEKNFIDSIEHQLTVRGTLSEKQAKKLETIYADKTS